MNNTVIAYESFHGRAKKVAEVIANKFNTEAINIDTPFEIEDLSNVNNIIMVFNFRGPYTAQFTKLYLSRVKGQIKDKNLILVGVGIFSEKEFPIVADEIYKLAPSKTFNKFFVNGELRMDILFREERILLKKFSELTKMEVKDMGNLNLEKAEEVSNEIYELLSKEEIRSDEVKENDKQKWVCPICGYVHYGDTAPEKCPMCGAPGNVFIKE